MLQQGLNEYFITHSVAFEKDAPSWPHFTWRYKEAKELIQWLQTNNIVIETINLCVTHEPMENYYGIGDWDFHGDKNKTKDENIYANFQSANQFVEDINAKNIPHLAYDIFFESEDNMKVPDREFYYKSIIMSGYNYDLDTAIDFIERCRVMKKTLLAVEVYKITGYYIQPIDTMLYDEDYDTWDPVEYLEMFHIEKYTDAGHWKEAAQFIKESAAQDIYFQIFHE